MTREQLHNLIEKIVAEVVRRVQLEERRRQHPEDVMVLLGGMAAYPEELREKLRSAYGEGYTLLDFDGGNRVDGQPVQSASSLGSAAVLRQVSQAKTVILAAPTVALLEKIAAGDDSRQLSHLLIRSILWKKDVQLWLDFAPPQFKRNSFMQGVSDAVDTLRAMQVKIVSYHSEEAASQQYCELLTEAAVLNAVERGDSTVYCKIGAIITPAARDAIAANEIIICYEGSKAECS